MEVDDGNDKPFPCTHKNCRMTFSNEDHLIVHRKKHDMELNLDLASKNNTIADQTPTPTRFIRTCEEVGLFQDLQNVNPFEETFKKAISSKDRITEVHSPNEDDTLHTPHILPHITPSPSKNKRIYDDEDSDFQISTTLVNIRHEEEDGDINILDDEDSDDEPMEVPVLEVVLNDSHRDDSRMNTDILYRLKESISHSKKQLGIPIERRPFQQQNNSKISIYSKHVPEKLKRREMNRMAQIRSRQKKRQLTKVTTDEMATLRKENDRLELENKQLRLELHRFKVRHKKCPNQEPIPIEPSFPKNGETLIMPKIQMIGTMKAVVLQPYTGVIDPNSAPGTTKIVLPPNMASNIGSLTPITTNLTSKVITGSTGTKLVAVPSNSTSTSSKFMALPANFQNVSATIPPSLHQITSNSAVSSSPKLTSSIATTPNVSYVSSNTKTVANLVSMAPNVGTPISKLINATSNPTISNLAMPKLTSISSNTMPKLTNISSNLTMPKLTSICAASNAMPKLTTISSNSSITSTKAVNSAKLQNIPGHSKLVSIAQSTENALSKLVSIAQCTETALSKLLATAPMSTATRTVKSLAATIPTVKTKTEPVTSHDSGIFASASKSTKQSDLTGNIFAVDTIKTELPDVEIEEHDIKPEIKVEPNAAKPQNYKSRYVLLRKTKK